jgi:hypothetical protein
MILTHGIPLSLYRDRHTIFQRNDAHWTVAEELAGKQSPTQLGRALEELGIQQIPAYSPQAKAASNALGASQPRAGEVLHRLQPALRPSRHRRSLRLPPYAPRLRSRPLPLLAGASSITITPSPWARMPLPCPVARPSRLCRKNRRTLASTRRHPAYLSRRPVSSHLALAARRTSPTPPCADYPAQKRKTSTTSPPPRFGGRYLNDNRGERISSQLIRHFSRRINSI